jgi:hypothetical protein
MKSTAELEMEQTFYEGFESAYRDARGYRYRAGRFMAEANPSHELVVNVASMAMERYLVAICQLRRRMPHNHNYASLMNTLKGAAAFPEALERGIRALDEIFGICSLDEYHHGTPEPEDAVRLVAMCDEVAAMLDGAAEEIAARRAQFAAAQ